MTYDMSFPTSAHRIELEGREKLLITGVDDVERFDENEVTLQTSAGTLVITGENLHIGKLSLDGGELCVDGHIESVNYEESAVRHGGLLSRLFG